MSLSPVQQKSFDRVFQRVISNPGMDASEIALSDRGWLKRLEEEGKIMFRMDNWKGGWYPIDPKTNGVIEESPGAKKYREEMEEQMRSEEQPPDHTKLHAEIVEGGLRLILHSVDSLKGFTTEQEQTLGLLTERMVQAKNAIRHFIHLREQMK